MTAPRPTTPAPALRVLAIGAFTPVGGDARATAAAVRAGLCGFREHPFMIDTVGEPMRVAPVAALGPDLAGAPRLAALLAPALDEALAGGRLAGAGAAARLGVAVGLPPARPGGPHDATDAVRALCRERLGDRMGPFQAFPSGHAAGFEALDQARAWLSAGLVDAVIVAGVDSYLAPETLAWLEEEEQLHGAGPLNNAWGFIPGEAAGALLLTREDAPGVWAEVLTVGLGRETKTNKSGTVCIGEGLTQALRHVLEDSPEAGVIDNVICDMNGEAYRADEYGFCGLRVRDRLRDPTDFLAPADCWGDVGAAGLPLHLLLAASAARKGHAKGPLTLLWGSSDGGQRGAALVRAGVRERA